jgi:hypothetical protein
MLLLLQASLLDVFILHHSKYRDGKAHSKEHVRRGLEADQRVLAAHGCYALTATTALTAQNTLGVQDIHVVPTEFVRKQIETGLEDIGTDVVKLGERSISINIHLVFAFCILGFFI